MKVKLKYRITVVKFAVMGIWFRISRYKYLKFDQDDPDDYYQFMRSAYTNEICAGLEEFDYWLRSQHKYGTAEEGTNQEVEQSYCYDIRSKLREHLENAGVNLEIIFG